MLEVIGKRSAAIGVGVVLVLLLLLLLVVVVVLLVVVVVVELWKKVLGSCASTGIFAICK